MMMSTQIRQGLLHLQSINLPRAVLSKMTSTLVSKFEEVKDATSNQDILIIDVREPQELKETGIIPNSINIPVGSVETVFKTLNNEKFRSNYGKTKPDFHDTIIVSCRSGKRSELSQSILQKLGYRKVYNYSGGWLDWEKNITK